MSDDKLICNVCNKNEALGVCCVPGCPVSVAYCKECLAANAHPWGILVASTACVGGLDRSAAWWQKMVRATCAHLGKTIEEFEHDVDVSIVEMANPEYAPEDGFEPGPDVGKG